MSELELRRLSAALDVELAALECIVSALLAQGWRPPVRHADIKFEPRRSPVYPQPGTSSFSVLEGDR